jgi:hypothetical protein
MDLMDPAEWSTLKIIIFRQSSHRREVGRRIGAGRQSSNRTEIKQGRWPKTESEP